MLKKFALTDDGSVKRLPQEVPEDNAEAAGRMLGTEVLYTTDKAGLKRLLRDINDAISEDEGIEALAHMNSLSLEAAMWWFIKNVPEDSPARTQCFFALRHRRANPAN